MKWLMEALMKNAKANKAWKQSFEKQELFQKMKISIKETTPVVYL